MNKIHSVGISYNGEGRVSKIEFLGSAVTAVTERERPAYKALIYALHEEILTALRNFENAFQKLVDAEQKTFHDLMKDQTAYLEERFRGALEDMGEKPG